MLDGFTFGEHSTSEFSMHVEKFPELRGTQRRYKSLPIPGRNGELHMDEEVFSNYIQSYECYFHGEESAPEVAHDIKTWLLGTSGPCKLADLYDPEHFHMAYYAGPFDVENTLNQFGRCVVKFDCSPQAFLTVGEQVQVFSVVGEITNPTAFEALPLIHVYGSGSGSVSVNGYTAIIHSISDVLTLDCELLDTYRQVGEGAPENKNGDVTVLHYPKLSPGNNGVSFSGGITKVEIIPRWWEL